MNIKTKLSIQYSLILTGVLLVFSVLVYYFSATSQVNRFRENLLETAKNAAILLINVAEVDSTLLKKIQQSTILLDKEELVLTDSNFKQIYSNNVQILSQQVIRENQSNDDVRFFSSNNKDGVYYKHHKKNHSYNVYVMAYDSARFENLSDLREILIWTVAFSIVFSVMFSYLFSKNAIKPISKIIKSIKSISSSKLSDRLDEGRHNDEIAQLAKSFNEMLSKLEAAFKNQKDFISNASHELRTPLSVMIAESDFMLDSEHTIDEYKKHLRGTVTDLKNLNAQINSLLELAQLNSDNRILMANYRIDEIVYGAIRHVKAKYPERKIISQIQYPENENELEICCNPGLLEIVFNNLLENACKFSTDSVIVEFQLIDEGIKIIVSDSGIGIPSDELKNIYNPFTRASNVKYKAGFGVGLSVVAKILELHDVVFIVHSQENIGTQFNMLFKKSMYCPKTDI
jgi:two-component system sensor histidine kinase ArlS